MARKRIRRGRGSAGGAGLQVMDVALSAGYGFVRQDIKDLAAPVIAVVPGGEFAENLALGGSAYLLHRFNVGGPLVKKAAKTIVLAEAYEAGKNARS